MGELELIFLILGLAFALWQTVLFAGFVAMLAKGYDKVTCGLAPGVIAVLFLIAAVLV